MMPFAIATLLPALLLGLACVLGGVWAILGILTITVVVFFLDKMGRAEVPSARTGHRLSEVLGIVHFILLGLAVWAMGGPLPTMDKVLIVVGCGLYFGQISNSNAHELIHRADRWAFRLGAANYISVLFGHHTSAHRLVHHVHVATPRDPASAPKGRGFWAYLPRTWAGSFRAGLRAERQRHGGVRFPAPYVVYAVGACVTLAIAYALGGGAGIAGLIAIALYAQTQLMLSDYVQHYGLRRAVLPSGKHAPMGPAHSWNAPHWYSSAMMLNAPRHSAHHTRPTRAFPQLDLDPSTMPVLPHSLPVMAVVALVPPLWRRVMDRRVDAWSAPHSDGEVMPAARVVAGVAPSTLAH
ncbi:alkane 1-monooxygenase [uncultured Tateyamaria sp.]|uniref:alkane 1-monooxygenase n=1 Tax=uncultured Tateyamaria sp. TaxID=455651 RepID=UPI002614657F|nr:alkane 1-monooxygenase [uncultured Tateyamaria sp.]